tara:strand:- start:199 stop:636 length:438 start_codon:yes stop_codon:yes gene_type:complete
MELHREKILFYQKNRDPFLMIDFVTDYQPGIFCNGYKLLKEDEWFFKVHWPQDPNMPGALQIEALTQMGALNILTLDGNAGKLVYVVAADKVKYKKKIVPKDKLIIQTNLISWKRNIGILKAESFVNDQPACSGTFTLVLEDFLS